MHSLIRLTDTDSESGVSVTHSGDSLSEWANQWLSEWMTRELVSKSLSECDSD